MPDENPYGFKTGVPIPPVNSAGGRTPKYPFKHMQPGHSKEFTASEAEVKRIQRAVAAFSRRNKVVMTTRRNKDRSGITVWRIS